MNNCVSPTISKVNRQSFSGRLLTFTYYALVFWIPIETIYLLDDGGSGFTISKLLGYLLFVVAIFNWRTCFKKIPLAFWSFAWYLGFYLASILWIPEGLSPGYYTGLFTLSHMAVLFLISINVFADTGFREALLRFYGWWTGLVAVGMVSGIIGAEFLGNTGRVSILAQDPNVTAGFLALGAICVVGSIKKFFSKRGLISISVVSVLIVAILQTGSRGGMLSLVVGVFGFGACIGRKSRFLTRSIVISIVVGLLGYLLIQEFNEGTVMASRLDLALRQGDTAGRTRIWGSAWEMFLEKPLLGYGGNYNFVLLGEYLNTFAKDTHNLFLALLTEVGVAGAAPLIIIFFSTFHKTWSYGKNTGNALPFALMCTLFSINMSLTGYHQKLFWVFFAVAVSSVVGLERAGKPQETKIGAQE